MSLELLIGILGILVDLALAHKAMSHLDGLLKFTAGFVFVFGFIGLLWTLFSTETAELLTGIYLLGLIIWYISKEEK
ncbi:MAG: hypothetical protein DDG60_11320 [Anaerolineae bacterium]|nr:MAG: hypothetical protein DDG60_11320 [Anaerolineae bacterium]